MSNNTPLPSSFDTNPDFYLENRWQKFTRRLKEEPLIPLGLTLTCMALYGAAKSVRAGDHERTNRMFRARIYAQGFTILAMVVGSLYWKTDRQKRKEFENLVMEQNAQAKRDAWVRELEARDEEEKALRAKRERTMAKQRSPNAEKPSIADSHAVDTASGTSEDRGAGVVETVQKRLGFGGKKE